MTGVGTCIRYNYVISERHRIITQILFPERKNSELFNAPKILKIGSVGSEIYFSEILANVAGLSTKLTMGRFVKFSRIFTDFFAEKRTILDKMFVKIWKKWRQIFDFSKKSFSVTTEPILIILDALERCDSKD